MQHTLPFQSAEAPSNGPWSPMEGVLVLPAFAGERLVLEHVAAIAAQAPFRHMVTPGGQKMSAEMTNCGAFGWVSDRRGYRYTDRDPDSGDPWPAMPDALLSLAVEAAGLAGFSRFAPDACLINRYAPGARMGLHQDKDEADFQQPVVTICAGLPGVFRITGARRTGPGIDIALSGGDALVLGGPSRLFYHGVRTVKKGWHEQAGPYRISLTFRHTQ